MTGRIFISYRRDDAKADARSIYQRLQRTFGNDQLFMDVDTIQKGLDFSKVLQGALSDTSVMLVVMGRQWLHISDENGHRRLDDPADYVRMEVANALARDIAVIPVRVDGARLPRVEELPDDISGLVRRQGTMISHENYAHDMDGLEADLRQLIGPAKRKRASYGAIAAGGVLAMVAAVGGGLWWSGKLPIAAPGQIAGVATTAPGALVDGAAAKRLREFQAAAEAVLKRQEEERSKAEAEARRRVQVAMADENRRKAEAARQAAAAEAKRLADEEARRGIEHARLAAEAEAQRRVQEEMKRRAEQAKLAGQKERAEREARALALKQEAEAAWLRTRQANTLAAYLDYLRNVRNGDHRTEARAMAQPMLLQAVQRNIDNLMSKIGSRSDGKLSYFVRNPNWARAAAACILWSTSTPERLAIVAKGYSGSKNGRNSLASREQNALGRCTTTRPAGSDCNCEIVYRNRQHVLKVPDHWIARQLD